MAQTHGAVVGVAKNAPMSVDRCTNPQSQHFLDLVEFFKTGKRNVTMRAKDGFQVLGYEPDQDTNETEKMLSVGDGCVFRAVVQKDQKDWNQTPSVLALIVSTGKADIVDDKIFHDARPHHEVHSENREKDLARQAKRQRGHFPLPQVEVNVAEMAGLISKVAELEVKLSALEAPPKGK